MTAQTAVLDNYRIVETLGGWSLQFQDPAMLRWHELQFQDPAMLRWHELAVRDTFTAAVAAYNLVCDGETMECYVD